MVMLAHSPQFPRYQISVLLALAGPITVGFGRLGRAGSLGLGALAVIGALVAYPALRAMHDTPLPPVAALRAVAAKGPVPSFIQRHCSHSQGSSTLRVSCRRGHVCRAGPTLPFPDTYAIGGRFLPGPNTCTWTFDDFPEEAWDLSQKRFNLILVARNPVLLGPGVVKFQPLGRRRRAAWLSDETELSVPAPSELLMLRVDVPKEHAPQRLQVSVRKKMLLAQTLEAGTHDDPVPLASCDDRCSQHAAAARRLEYVGQTAQADREAARSMGRRRGRHWLVEVASRRLRRTSWGRASMASILPSRAPSQVRAAGLARRPS